MNLMSLLPMAALGFGLGLSLSPIRIAAAEAPIHGADRGRITLDAADAALSGPKLSLPKIFRKTIQKMVKKKIVDSSQHLKHLQNRPPNILT